MQCVWGFYSWVDGNVIPELENSGKGAVGKVISFQRNYSAIFNLLVLGNSFMGTNVL